MLTSGVNALADDVKATVLTAVRTFHDFDEGNDPQREHDFLSVNVCGHEIFAKIDYYDSGMRFGADDPSDPVHTGAGVVKTQIASVLGLSQMNIGARSEIATAGANLEIALVLDNTGSMASSGKMEALKAASKMLLTS